MQNDLLSFLQFYCHDNLTVMQWMLYQKQALVIDSSVPIIPDKNKRYSCKRIHRGTRPIDFWTVNGNANVSRFANDQLIHFD